MKKWHIVSFAIALSATVMAWVLPVQGRFCLVLGVSLFMGLFACAILIAIAFRLAKEGNASVAYLVLLGIIGGCAICGPVSRWNDHRYFCLTLKAVDQMIFLRTQCGEDYSRTNQTEVGVKNAVR